MGVFLENTIYQDVIEKAENTDKQTGFFNNLYLYSKARQKLLQVENSVFALLVFNNLSDINIEYSRNVGNLVLTKAINVIKELTSSDTMCIRYSGARILLVTPDCTAENIHPIIEKILARIKSDAVENIDNKFVNISTQVLIHTFKKQNNIEKEIGKMVLYTDNMKETDTIKII